MEKEEIKKTVEDITEKTKSRIIANPIPAFFIGLVVGYLVGNNKEFFMPILALIVVTLIVLYVWLSLADKPTDETKPASE